MNGIRVTNVKGLQGDARNGVCYVGRAFAGWPTSPWGNPFRPAPGFDAVAAYRQWFLGRPAGEVERALADLWEACDHGVKPLGCWCVEAVHGDGQPVVCHAQVLAELLTEWVARGEVKTPKPDTWKPNPCGCRGCNICGMYGLAPKPVVALPQPDAEPVMRAFGTMDLREAEAFAAAGGQALHLHNIIVDRSRAPKCFVRDVDAGRPIAHLFDADVERLKRTARGLGVKVIVVERTGQPGQHIDLCGGPLAKAMAMVDNPAEAKAVAAAFAEDAEPIPARKPTAPTLFDEVPT
jgi:hypothetical protein